MAEQSEGGSRQITVRWWILGFIGLFFLEELIRLALWVSSWTGSLPMLTHGAVLYKLGELFIVAPILILIAFLSLWTRERSISFISRARWFMWLGAILNGMALFRLTEECWWSPWIPILIVGGVFVPLALKGLLARCETHLVQIVIAIVIGLFTLNYALNWPETKGMVIDLPTPRPRETTDRVERWRQDLRYLARELPRRHANPFFKSSKEDFYEKVKALEEAIPTLEDHQIFVGMIRLAASLGDPHTHLWAWDNYRFRAYPVFLAWYGRGPFVLLTTEEHRRYLRMRVGRIGKCDADSALLLVSELIPHTSETELYATAADRLCRPEILHALGIIDNMDSCQFVLEDSLLQEHTLTVYPENPDSLVWAPRSSEPAYSQRNSELYYWYEIFEDDGVLYFKYNDCMEEYPNDFSDFCSKMFEELRQKNIRTIVVDFRYNGGGAETLFDDFMTNLRQTPSVLENGHLIGITNPHIAGAAAANAIRFQRETGAVFFGQPPEMTRYSFWESGILYLPNSEGRLYYSQVDPNTYLTPYDSVTVQFRIPRAASPYMMVPGVDRTLDSVMSYVRTLTIQKPEIPGEN